MKIIENLVFVKDREYRAKTTIDISLAIIFSFVLQDISTMGNFITHKIPFFYSYQQSGLIVHACFC